MCICVIDNHIIFFCSFWKLIIIKKKDVRLLWHHLEFDFFLENLFLQVFQYSENENTSRKHEKTKQKSYFSHHLCMQPWKLINYKINIIETTTVIKWKIKLARLPSLILTKTMKTLPLLIRFHNITTRITITIIITQNYTSY